MSAARDVTTDITVRRNPWQADSEVTVTLNKQGYLGEWTVYHDGRQIGRVRRYTGSLDRKAGRTRIPGKQRTLWAYTIRTDGSPPLRYGHVSRADCIRQMLFMHGVTS